MKCAIEIMGKEVFALPRKERTVFFSRQLCEDIAHLLESSRMEDGRYDGHVGFLCVMIDPAEVRKCLLGKKVRYLVLLKDPAGRPCGIFVVEGDCAWELEISDFFVRREYRNKGYGTKMMKTFLARLKKDCAKCHVSLRLNVKLGNEGAERFYNRFGFNTAAKLMRREVGA